MSIRGSLQKWAGGMWPQSKTVDLNNQLYYLSTYHEGTINKAKRKMFSYLQWFVIVLSHRFLHTSNNEVLNLTFLQQIVSGILIDNLMPSWFPCPCK